MIDIHLKHDNMHKNGMFYALIYINNIISCINYMLSISFSKLLIKREIEEIREFT